MNTRKRPSYDSKCFDLAKAFLSDEPDLDTQENADELAKDIQATIEDFLQYDAMPRTKSEAQP